MGFDGSDVSVAGTFLPVGSVGWVLSQSDDIYTRTGDEPRLLADIACSLFSCKSDSATGHDVVCAPACAAFKVHTATSMMGMLTIMLGPLLCIWLAHCLHVFKYAACTYGDHC